MTEERFCELASLALSNEATPEELAELTAMAKQNPEVRTRLEQLTAIWNAKSISQESISTVRL
jgi:hypothetical protein